MGTVDSQMRGETTIASAGPAVRRRVFLPLALANGTQAEAVAISFAGLSDPGEHIALAFDLERCERARAAAVRVHSECLTGDVFGSARCDCGAQLRDAMATMVSCGGVILYLRQEGRGIGLYNKLDAYFLQEEGLDTFTANRTLAFQDDQRDYGIAAEMLRALGLLRIRLLTNNPDKAHQLARHGIAVDRVIATKVHVTAHNHRYLTAKRDSAGHHLDLPCESALGDGEGRI